MGREKETSFFFRVLVSLATRHGKQIVFIMMLILGAHVLLSPSILTAGRIAVLLSVKNRCNLIVLELGQLTYVVRTYIHIKRIGTCSLTVRQNIISKRYAMREKRRQQQMQAVEDARR